MARARAACYSAPYDERAMKKMALKPCTHVRRAVRLAWGKRLSQGTVPIFPILLSRSTSLNVTRGNKRYLRLTVNPRVSESAER